MFGYREDEALGQSLALIVPRALQPLRWRGSTRAFGAGELKPAKSLPCGTFEAWPMCLALVGEICAPAAPIAHAFG